MTEYNGWKNRQTWNVSLWIANDEALYREAVAFMQTYRGRFPYTAFVKNASMDKDRTPDNIGWLSTRLDYKALNEFMCELAS